jgi:hypothetical protein
MEYAHFTQNGQILDVVENGDFGPLVRRDSGYPKTQYLGIEGHYTQIHAIEKGQNTGSHHHMDQRGPQIPAWIP